MKKNILLILGLAALLVVSAGVFSPVLASPSLDVDCEKNPNNPNCQEHKVLICHLPPGNPENGQEILVDESSWNTPGAGDHGPGRHGGDYLITDDSLPCNNDDGDDGDDGEETKKAKKKQSKLCKVGCGPHIDEEAICESSRIGINFYPLHSIYGGNKTHLWSFESAFEIRILGTEEIISAEERSTPKGTVWVIDIDTTGFQIFVGEEQIFDSCKNLPCSTSGWSYVDGTFLQPYGPYNQSELAEWFFNDPLFNVDDWIDARDWARQVAESLQDDLPFDLTPFLAQ